MDKQVAARKVEKQAGRWVRGVTEREEDEEGEVGKMGPERRAA